MSRRRHKCKICGQRHSRTSKHHYYPRPYHKGHRQEWDYICDSTHRDIHQVYDNYELAHVYNDAQSLRMQLMADGLIDVGGGKY